MENENNPDWLTPEMKQKGIAHSNAEGYIRAGIDSIRQVLLQTIRDEGKCADTCAVDKVAKELARESFQKAMDEFPW